MSSECSSSLVSRWWVQLISLDSDPEQDTVSMNIGVEILFLWPLREKDTSAEKTTFFYLKKYSVYKIFIYNIIVQ